MEPGVCIRARQHCPVGRGCGRGGVWVRAGVLATTTRIHGDRPRVRGPVVPGGQARRILRARQRRAAVSRRRQLAVPGPRPTLRVSALERFVLGLALCAAVGFTAWNVRCIRLTSDWVPDPSDTRYVQNALPQGRLLVWFDWGEYAIWHMGPGVQVSFDGRRETVDPALHSRAPGPLRGTARVECVPRPACAGSDLAAGCHSARAASPRVRMAGRPSECIGAGVRPRVMARRRAGRRSRLWPALLSWRIRSRRRCAPLAEARQTRRNAAVIGGWCCCMV